MPSPALLAALLAAAPATPAPPGPPRPFVAGPSVEGVTEATLPNGLRVLLVPDPSKPTVTVNLTVFVGSRHEGYGEKGMAHLLEHLLFKGTPKIPDPKKELTERGADANGTTWFDRTNYYETVPAQGDNLEWALRFEADRFQNAHIARADLEKEMTVVRSEFEMGESMPESVLPDRVLATAYLWHNYGNTTIGARSDIELVPIDNLKGFYKRHYRPDNALLVVAGRFDPPKAWRLVADTFGRIPKAKAPPPATWTEEPTQDGERSVTVRRTGGNPLLVAGYHLPAGTDPDFAAADVLSFVLGDAPSGALYKALVETKKASRVSCDVLQLREPGFLMCSAELGPKDAVAPARDALLATLEGFAAKPPAAAAVERAKLTLLKGVELTLNTSERIGIDLSEWAALGDWRMFFVHRDRLAKVTPADVQRVALAYLKASNRTLGEYVPTEKPDRAQVPKVPDVAAVVKDYQGREALAVGEAFEATPRNIEARTRRLALPGGMKVALLEKRTRGQTVAVSAMLRYGTVASLTNQGAVAEFTAAMLTRGTRKRSREAFKQELDRLKARLDVRAGPNGVLVMVEVRRPELSAALDLVVEALREPAFDAAELETLRREVLSRIEAERTEPMSAGFIALQRLVSPWPKGHPFAVPTFDERAQDALGIRLEQLQAFHGRFYGAQAGQLSVVGDFDGKDLEERLRALFGGWTAKEPFARIPQPFRANAPAAQSVALPDKANAFTGVGLALAMKDTDPDYAALVMADFMLGGGFLNGRIPTRLREKEGVSYGAGTFFRAPALDDGAYLLGYAIHAPENDRKVEAGFREELALAARDGFTEAELESARQGMLRERENRRADDAELARTLTQYLFIDRTMAFEEALDQRLLGLKAKDVGGALSKHLDPRNLSLVKAGDFKTVGAPQ